MWLVVVLFGAYAAVAITAWQGGRNIERARHHLMMSRLLQLWGDHSRTVDSDPAVIGPFLKALMQAEREAYSGRLSMRALRTRYDVDLARRLADEHGDPFEPGER